MESSALSEQVEWQSRRLAAAFGVEEWMASEADEDWECSGEGRGDVLVSWAIERSTTQLFSIEVGPKSRASISRYVKPWASSCTVIRHPEDTEDWEYFSHPLFNEFMAHGLYCLGFEHQSVLSQLPSLTAHEKLELRLSMPREFWPQKWFDEKDDAL